MSNKFFEIGREATKWCCENVDHQDREWEYKWEQKYGELIVQRCISQIAMMGIANWENDDISWAVEGCIDNIKAHFGVYDENL